MATAPDHGEADDDVTIRRADATDVGAILRLGERSLGWLRDDIEARFFAWKHRDNPFGPSPMWVAEADGRVVGFRTFLRWELVSPFGPVCRAVRAVDTATDPEHRGRGIFTRLTLTALDELRTEGVDFVFNTPNGQSRPGYLKMGWRVVGRLPVAVRPTRLGSLPVIARARQPASRDAVAVTVGDPAAEVFAERDAVDELLQLVGRPTGLATRRSAAYLLWRYGFGRLHYRALVAPAGVRDGVVVFHLRRRGPALEAVVGDVLVPAGDHTTARGLLRRIAAESGADYVLGLDSARGSLGLPQGFWPLPRAGPILTTRDVCSEPPRRQGWALTLGDIELF
jgi:GNAT superfamily N-acetyltransferase